MEVQGFKTVSYKKTVPETGRVDVDLCTIDSLCTCCDVKQSVCVHM